MPFLFPIPLVHRIYSFQNMASHQQYYYEWYRGPEKCETGFQTLHLQHVFEIAMSAFSTGQLSSSRSTSYLYRIQIVLIQCIEQNAAGMIQPLHSTIFLLSTFRLSLLVPFRIGSLVTFIVRSCPSWTNVIGFSGFYREESWNLSQHTSVDKWALHERILFCMVNAGQESSRDSSQIL